MTPPPTFARPSVAMRTACRRALAATTLAAAAAGCRTAAIYVPAVRMQLSVQPVEVRGGDSVRLTVTLTNPQPDSVLLEFGEECRVSYLVMDETGRPVAPAKGASCLAPRGRPLVLAPGGTWRAEGAWRATAADGGPLAPGAYSVGAVLGDHHSTVRGKRAYKMSSGAAPVPIRLLSAASPALAAP